MKAVARTDQGMVRKTNEDTVYCSVKPVGKLPNLFVVADGMGGANAGDYASNSAISEMVRFIQDFRGKATHTEIMRRAIEATNANLFRESGENPDHSGMGTTLVTAVIEDGVLYVTNVGDSRLYIIADEIRQITKDHSYVEEMVGMGRMKRGSREYKEKKNLITRAIGIGGTVDIDFFELPIAEGTQVLLCSDGLSNMLEDEEIFRLVKSAAGIQSAATRLIEAANASGGKDNVSVVLIENRSEGGMV